MRDRAPSSSSSEGSPPSPSSLTRPSSFAQLPTPREPINDFALAGFQTPESLEKLVNAFKVYDQEQTNRRLAAMFNNTNGPGLRVVPYRTFDQFQQRQQNHQELQQRLALGMLPTSSEADEDEVQEQIDQARLEELAGSEVETIVPDDQVPTLLEEMEGEIETEPTQTQTQTQMVTMTKPPTEPQTSAKAAKRAKQKEKKKKSKAKAQSLAVDSTAARGAGTVDAAALSTSIAPDLDGIVINQVPINEGVCEVSTIEKATLHETLHSNISGRIGPDFQSTPSQPEVHVELADDDGLTKGEEDRYPEVDSSESDGPLTPQPIHGASRAEPIRPESVRTEMTLVLGEDDVDGLALDEDPDLAPVFSPPTATLPALTDKQEQEPIVTAPTSPPMSPDPVTFNKRLTSPQPTSHDPLNFLSPDTSSPEADIDTPPGPTDEKSDSSPESPASQGTSMLLASERLQFGMFQHHEYPKHPTIAPTLPRRPAVQGPISIARSPLALAPPITPSALHTPTPQSLEPTRQNTPVSEISGSPYQAPAQINPTSIVETSEHVIMPKTVNKQDPASVHGQPLNHAYTLYSSNTKAKPTATSSTVATPLHGSVGLGNAPSADTYSNELVPIFTAYTLGDFFGSWKGLRRKLAHVYGRPIEPEGSLQIPAGTEGLGLYLCPGVRTVHFFRQGVKPMWEDPMCGKGGKIMYAGRADEACLADNTFFRVVLAVIAGCFDVDVPAPGGTDNTVVGVVLSKREKHSRVEVWLGGTRPPPRQWVIRVEQFLKTDVPGQWYGYKSFH